MPGWHEKLKDRDDVVQLGLIQEQHPDRCKLFMQWKEMDWPIMVDSLNLIGVKVVPITLFIDEHGVIRNVKPKHEDLDEFVQADFPAPSDETPEVARPNPEEAESSIEATVESNKPTAESLRRAGDTAFLWLKSDAASKAYELYRSALMRAEADGEAEFRAGVAARRKSDESDDADEYFARAVKHWERSLEIDPNHYIRRRRIQQYGPRLDKPYPFYDWVNTAREDINERGDTPVELAVEPGGAELAHPDKSFDGAEGESNPDPDGRINRDKDGLIEIDSTPVPGKIEAGQASRVHVSFKTNEELKAHWNNESGDSVVWVDAPEGWKLDRQLWTLPLGEGATSTEDRQIEFETRAPEDAEPGEYTLDAYALYYACEGLEGTCLYLRQEFKISLHIRQ